MKQEQPSLFKPNELALLVYNIKSPPKNWCNIRLLLLHEAIQMEMEAMHVRSMALKEGRDDSEDSWHVLYFSNGMLTSSCTWFTATMKKKKIFTSHGWPPGQQFLRN